MGSEFGVRRPVGALVAATGRRFAKMADSKTAQRQAAAQEKR
jgi:hypothetical protein